MDINAKEPRVTTRAKKECNFDITTGAQSSSLLNPTENATSIITKYHNLRQSARTFVDSVIHDAHLSLYVDKSFHRAVSIDATTSKEMQEKFDNIAKKSEESRPRRGEYQAPRLPESSSDHRAEKEFKTGPGTEEINTPRGSRLSESKRHSSTKQSIDEISTTDLLKYPAITEENKFAEYRPTINEEAIKRKTAEESMKTNEAAPNLLNNKGQEPRKSYEDKGFEKPDEKRLSQDKSQKTPPSTLQEDKFITDDQEISLDEFSKYPTTAQEENTGRNEEKEISKRERKISQDESNKVPSDTLQEDKYDKGNRRLSQDKMNRMSQDIYRKDYRRPSQDKYSPRRSKEYTGAATSDKREDNQDQTKNQEVTYRPEVSIINDAERDMNLGRSSRQGSKIVDSNSRKELFKSNPDLISDDSMLANRPKRSTNIEDFRVMGPLESDEESKQGTTSSTPQRRPSSSIRGVGSSPGDEYKNNLGVPDPRLSRNQSLMASQEIFKNTSEIRSAEGIYATTGKIASSWDDPNRVEPLDRRKGSIVDIPEGDEAYGAQPPARDGPINAATSQIGSQESRKTLTRDELETLQDNIQRINELVATVNERTLINNPTLVSELANLLYVSSAVLQSTSSQKNAGGPSNARNYPENEAPNSARKADPGQNIEPSSQKKPGTSQGNTKTEKTTRRRSRGNSESRSPGNTKRYSQENDDPNYQGNSGFNDRQNDGANFPGNTDTKYQANAGADYPGQNSQKNNYQNERGNEGGGTNRMDFQHNDDIYSRDNTGPSPRGNTYPSRYDEPTPIQHEQPRNLQHLDDNHSLDCDPQICGTENSSDMNNAGYCLTTAPCTSHYTGGNYPENIPPTSSEYVGPYSAEENTGPCLPKQTASYTSDNAMLYPTSSSEYIDPYSPTTGVQATREIPTHTDATYGPRNERYLEATNAYYSEDASQNPSRYTDTAHPQTLERPERVTRPAGYVNRDDYEHQDGFTRPVSYEHGGYDRTEEFEGSREYINDINYQEGYWRQNNYDGQHGYGPPEEYGREGRYDRRGSYGPQEGYNQSEGYATQGVYGPEEYEPQRRRGSRERSDQQEQIREQDGFGSQGNYGYQEGYGPRGEYIGGGRSGRPEYGQQGGYGQTEGRRPIEDAENRRRSSNSEGSGGTPRDLTDTSSRGKKNKSINRTRDAARYRLQECVQYEVINLIPKSRMHLQSLQRLARSPVHKIGRNKFCVVNSKVNKMLDRIFPFSSTSAIPKNRNVYSKSCINRKLSLIEASKEYLNRDRYFRKSI